MGQTGAETIDEIAEREIALHQVFVVILDVICQLAHQRGVHLLEPAQGVSTGVKDMIVACLPPLELRSLAGSLLTANLDYLSCQIELLPLHFEHLPKGVKRLILQVHHHVKENDRVIGIVDGRGALPSRRDFHAIRPSWR